MRSIVACLWLALAACSSPSEPQTAVPKSPASPPSGETARGTHASDHATPGSHEDWCGEHEVPESLCTRCNAKLIPAFKATGDWCESHGLPKSQCKACDPKLVIARPAKQGP